VPPSGWGEDGPPPLFSRNDGIFCAYRSTLVERPPPTPFSRSGPCSGLTNEGGNPGEDVKEIFYYYLDAALKLRPTPARLYNCRHRIPLRMAIEETDVAERFGANGVEP